MVADLIERVAVRSCELPEARDPVASDLHWLPGARAVQALTLVGCRWPIGEVADETFRFCGEPKGRGSYCAAHRKLAYVGVSR